MAVIPCVLWVLGRLDIELGRLVMVCYRNELKDLLGSMQLDKSMRQLDIKTTTNMSIHIIIL